MILYVLFATFVQFVSLFCLIILVSICQSLFSLTFKVIDLLKEGEEMWVVTSTCFESYVL